MSLLIFQSSTKQRGGDDEGGMEKKAINIMDFLSVVQKSFKSRTKQRGRDDEGGIEKKVINTVDFLSVVQKSFKCW